MKIYLAGPLFTQAERRWNRIIKEAIEKLNPDLEVLLPQDFEMEFRDGKPDAPSIFSKDVEVLDSCELVVAILDGSDSDSGTAWECGYAYAKSTPVIGVRTDFRLSEDGHLNIMLGQSMDVVVQESFDESAQKLCKKIVQKIEDKGLV